MKTRKGKLTISQPTSNTQEDCPVEITVTDETSGCIAMEVTVSARDFLRAVMKLAYLPCDYFVNESGVLGKRHEVKQVVVQQPKGRTKDGITKAEATRLAKEHLVDGWEINSLSDFTNHHRWVDRDKVSVTLVRFVDAPAGDA